MIFKTLLHSSLFLSLLFVFSLSANEQANTCVAAKNSIAHATAVAVDAQATTVEVEDVTQSQSEWLHRNEPSPQWTSNSGFASTRLMANDDPAGGKTAQVADDIPVPDGETWKVDTIKCHLFWNVQQADHYQVQICDDEFGFPKEEPLYDFTFTVDLPTQLTLYAIDVNTVDQNIQLSGGVKWLCIMGVYENGTVADGFVTYWNRDTVQLGLADAVARDSMGLLYGSYPIGWLLLQGTDEPPYNSFRFWIRGTRTTDINTNSFQKPKSLVSVYPNPASDYILFRFDKTIGKYVEMYDVTGKLVQRVDLKKDNNKVPVKSLKNGVYTYRLIGKSGRMIDKGRFTVSR